jgi:hypothetical protein
MTPEQHKAFPIRGDFLELIHTIEALVLIRGGGEIANLLWLFDADPTALGRWKAAEAAEEGDTHRSSYR